MIEVYNNKYIIIVKLKKKYTNKDINKKMNWQVCFKIIVYRYILKQQKLQNTHYY